MLTQRSHARAVISATAAALHVPYREKEDAVRLLRASSSTLDALNALQPLEAAVLGEVRREQWPAFQQTDRYLQLMNARLASLRMDDDDDGPEHSLSVATTATNGTRFGNILITVLTAACLIWYN